MKTIFLMMLLSGFFIGTNSYMNILPDASKAHFDIRKAELTDNLAKLEGKVYLDDSGTPVGLNLHSSFMESRFNNEDDRAFASLFETEKAYMFRFISDNIEYRDYDKSYRVHGMFYMNGLKTPMTIPLNIATFGQYEGRHMTVFASDFSIKLNDYGVDKSRHSFGNSLDIQLELAAVKMKEEASGTSTSKALK